MRGSVASRAARGVDSSALVAATETPPETPKQVVKTAASIMPTSAVNSFIRSDFVGTVAAMKELQESAHLPRIDIDASAFSSGLVKCICNEVQCFLFAKEMGFHDDFGSPRDDYYGLSIDVASSKVFHDIHKVSNFTGKKKGDGDDDGCKLFFAGRVNCLKGAPDKSFVVALIRVIAASSAATATNPGNVLLCLPVVVHADYFGGMGVDNKDSCSIMAWMCRQVSVSNRQIPVK